MTDVLLDTCVVIDFLRGDGCAITTVGQLTALPHVSVVTVSEIHAGLKSQKSEHEARRFFAHSRMLPVTAPIAEAAGNHLRHYRASHGLDVPDALIAATAEIHGLALLTLNVKHFPMLKGLRRAY